MATQHADRHGFIAAVFSVRLPTTPAGFTPFVPAAGPEGDPDALHALMQQVRARQVLAGFHTIWNWRQGAADDEFSWIYPVASSAFRGRLLESVHSSSASIQAAQPNAPMTRHMLTVCSRFANAKLYLTVATPPPRTEYVLFFDGGSRGDPGPGGAGAVVLPTDRQRTTPHFVWNAAMSVASTSTTNNQAKYLGLVTDLAAAARNNWRPLEVVGASLLIVRQMVQYRPPKNETLFGFYLETRSLADTLGVIRWHHHLRAYNKMADAAANVAMDTMRSIQTSHPTSRPEWVGLDQHITSGRPASAIASLHIW